MGCARFHPDVARWFAEHVGSPTETQALGWAAVQRGSHTLITAPTGSGKTFAAFFVALDQLFREGLGGELPDATRVLYVSPLKALSNDIHVNLQVPLAGLKKILAQSEGREVDVRAGLRTGDTPAAVRQAMTRRPPHLLVTTPESLYLLLTSASGRKMLSTVRTLIIDEIHALVGNRRGSHLSLSVERLAALVGGPLQRIGLSATQNPIETVARFLTGYAPGGAGCGPRKVAECAVIDAGFRRDIDLAIEVPSSPLEAVMSNEVWTEIYTRLATLIREHRTTLVFVNTRRLAERVTYHLTQRLGPEAVMSHHGSLSTRLRLDAEQRLKRGELRALVATASLELGIDIGSIDLVCQLGPTRSIATLLQRVGRAEHRLGGRPKGRIFPLSRDELVECLATMQSLRQGILDRVEIPDKPLDVLAQQIVAIASQEDCQAEELFELVRRAYPYRNLARQEFDQVIHMLAEGFSTKRGRRGSLVHYDAVNQRIRARRGARLVAITSGGAIPDNSDYRVLLEPDETFVGTVNEDFAVESLAGDIFLLGNASWRILRIDSGTLRVQSAEGQPPNIPFWLGEAPGRTNEVSQAVSSLLSEIGRRTDEGPGVEEYLRSIPGLPESAAQQLAQYLSDGLRVLGALPSHDTLIMERFFDESGGMQMVIHSRFGIRMNRAWGLALRKRFCRSFNFELQAAATDDAIVLSLGTQHSFPLEEVFRYLKSTTVRDLLVQALLDAPMFPVRWRWNASRALALLRQRGGHKTPAPLQRMEAENLLAAVFPDQLACLENIQGDREVPDHPLVQQTIEDCLTEAMDVSGLIELLRKIENGRIRCLARDLPEPSPLAHEILNARPYAFLDNAPLEERRTHAVYTRRGGESPAEDGLGILDPAAIAQVRKEAFPRATNADEMHDALLVAGFLLASETGRTGSDAPEWLRHLAEDRRASLVTFASRQPIWVAAERFALIQEIFPSAACSTPLAAIGGRAWDRADALRELVRGRMEISGPLAESALADLFQVESLELKGALLALESEGFLLRGCFQGTRGELEWCDRRLLARIHRLTLNRLRAEIQPVSLAQFQRFLLAWQHVSEEERADGPEGLAAVLEQLDGYELAAGAWEPEVLSLRVKNYDPRWLDQACLTGRVGWGRLTPPRPPNGRLAAPIRSTPISLFLRDHLSDWLALSPVKELPQLSGETATILEFFRRRGALFFGELLKQRSLLPSRVEQALAELAAQGWVNSDGFEGIRALLLPQEKRLPFVNSGRKRRHKGISSVEHAGRWSLLREPQSVDDPEADSEARSACSGEAREKVSSERDERGRKREDAVEIYARALLLRYGVVFRKLIERESFNVSWYELGRSYRRLEARGEIRGGHFVGGVGGEQFALPEAVARLRALRKTPAEGELIVLSGADPLNLAGILTPGKRVSAVGSNRLLLRDGVPMGALEGREILNLAPDPEGFDEAMERRLCVGTLPASLRPYYSHS